MSTLRSNTIKPTSGDTVTFSDCDVTVGGTLTYDDVTNIDSVGLITARSGIEVSGIVTAPTYYGSGANLTGFESGVVNFVASGTIDNGATVIIKDDGTVGIVTQTGSAASVGSESVFVSASSHEYALTYDSDDNKIVVIYRDGADNYGRARVGTVSGTSISWGTAVEFNGASTEYFAIAYMGSSKVFIAYRDNGNSGYGTGIVGTVSGTDISFGSEAVFATNEITDWSSVVYDPDTGKVVIAYQDNVSPHYGRAVVATVSGTTISYGSLATFESAYVKYIGTVYDTTNDKVVIAYQDYGNSRYGTAIVGTVSGTSISFGTPAIFNSNGETSYMSETLGFTNGKVVIAYKDEGDSNKAKAVVATVSGTDISFGTPAVYDSDGTMYTSISSNSSNGEVLISYQDEGNSDSGTAIVATVSGTDITFGTPLVYNSGQSSYTASTYDSTSDQAVIAYRDAGGSYYGTAVVYSFSTIGTNLTTENYIGIAGEAIANGATGKVNVVGGVNSSQSGLTTAQTYYVGQTGILTTTADTPSVVAGTSISDTKILVR